MSGILPLFNSAPRIKVRINGKTLAYAIGFNIGISIDVQPISIIGSFQPIALEPLMYNIVTGTMQIIRLVSATTRASSVAVARANKNKQISGASDLFDDTNNPLRRDTLYQHLDPRQVLSSQSFDIDLYMGLPPSDSNGATIAVAAGMAPADQVLWMTVKDCRITSRNTNIAMGSLTNEPLTFQGIYVSPTSTSGDQLFASDNATQEAQS